jgi:hypothetical protein
MMYEEQLYQRDRSWEKSCCRLILVLILIAAQLLPCATAEISKIFAKCDKSVEIGNIYPMEIWLDCLTNPPADPTKEKSLSKPLNGDLDIMLDGSNSVSYPQGQHFVLNSDIPVVRPRFEPLRAGQANVKICYKFNSGCSGCLTLHLDIESTEN